MLNIQQRHEQKTLTTGQIQTLQVPVGKKIQSMILAFYTSAGALVTEAQIRAEISNIQLKFNDKTIINASPDQLLDLFEAIGNKVANASGVNGGLELNLGRLLFTDPAAKDLYGLGTADISSIQVTVTAGTLSQIASVQTFTSRELGTENAPLGSYISFVSYPQSFNATGEHYVDTLPRNTDSAYLALMTDDGASGVISEQEIKIGANAIQDKVPLGINKLFNALKQYDQPAGYYAKFFADGRDGVMLPMVRVSDFRVITTFSTAPGSGGYKIAALVAQSLTKTDLGFSV